MANEWPSELQGSPIDLQSIQDAMFGRGDPDDLAYELEEDDDALATVTRGIAANHVEVVARFARAVFGACEIQADHQQFAAALSSLQRLADATGNRPLAELLEPMLQLVTTRAARKELRRDRARFLPKLTGFVEAYAAHLPPKDAERLTEMVRWEPDRVPLLTELAELSGIGRRRLERLYCCGLYEVETVARADPAELAAVCGLPASLAEQIIEATRQFAIRERARSLSDARSRIQDFARMAAALGTPVPDALIGEVLEMVTRLEAAPRGAAAPAPSSPRETR